MKPSDSKYYARVHKPHDYNNDGVEKVLRGVERAVSTVGGGAHYAVTAVNNGRHNAADAIRAYLNRKPRHNKVDAIGSNIDLCECSRRVQGHLAILYPELH